MTKKSSGDDWIEFSLLPFAADFAIAIILFFARLSPE